MRYFRYIHLLITSLVLAIDLLGCGSDVRKVSETRELMGTFVEITAYDRSPSEAKRAIDLAFKEMERIDQLMSTYKRESEVSRLNRDGYLENPSQELRYVIEKSKEAPFETRHAIGRDNVFFVGDSANQNVKPFIEGFLPAIICGHALGKNLEGLDVASYKALIDETLPEISQSEFLIEPMIKLFKRKDNGRFNELLDLMIGN